jgi:hypothetical protein
MSVPTLPRNSNFIPGEILKTGAFFVDEDMTIKVISAFPDQFESLCMDSIIYALRWFKNKVLVNKTDGYYLRQKLTQGVTFDEELNKYFVNSYYYWLNFLNVRKMKEDRRFGGRKFTSSFRPVVSTKSRNKDIVFDEIRSKSVDLT